MYLPFIYLLEFPLIILYVSLNFYSIIYFQLKDSQVIIHDSLQYVKLLLRQNILDIIFMLSILEILRSAQNSFFLYDHF